MSKSHAKPDYRTESENHLPRESQRLDNVSSPWVIIPAYNEAKSITNVVVSLQSEGYTVVVVDDGSADETADLARSAGAIVLQHCQNLGQGGALWTGITFGLHAGAELICTFDADGQHCAGDIRRMWECLTEDDADVVLGSRFLGSSPGISFSRRLLLRLVVLFTRLQTSLNVTDAHNGIRLMRAAAASRLDLKQLGMAHASEIIERIADLKLKWREVPVTVRYTEYSKRKGQSTLDSISILVDLVIGRMTR